MRAKFPLGNDMFTEIRKNGDYYVDKTQIIRELLAEPFKAQLITRPRRFGKTLTMTMLEDFFDIQRDSQEDFEELAIMKEEKLCADWMNQWPTIFFTFKNVGGNTFEDAFSRFKLLFSDLCVKYSFLPESPDVNPADKALFQKLSHREADKAETCDALYLLTRMMNAHYGKPAILLIDEYDVPLAKASDFNYYGEMLDVIQPTLSKALKSNEFLKFAVVAGCLKISKESIFTGMNNFVSDTISSDRFDEYIGFTKIDVERILADIGRTGCADTVREWYNGYHFGSVEVYCPWDVLNYAAKLQANPKAEPELYWANTSGNSILRRFLRKAGRTAKAEIEKLISGGSIFKKLNEQLTYHELGQSMDNLWSVMYSTGYLTQKGKNESGKIELAIPNREVQEIFTIQIRQWFEEDVVKKNPALRDKLFRALKSGDAPGIEEHLNAFLNKSISIRDTFAPNPRKESFYHGILLGMLMGCENWYVRPNNEDGEGYSDIHVEIEEESIAFIIEVKYAENNALESGCREAIRQIEEKKYAQGLCGLEFRTVYAYGIACCKKHCKVMCKVYNTEGNTCASKNK